MLILFISIAAVILAAILIFIVVWQVRTRNFSPTKDKAVQQQQLNAALQASGFAYERKGDYFYSLMDCWQRQTGYCSLYDAGAPLFNMIMDCEPVSFSYAGKRWLIELWKGQYGITTGAEIGIYNTSRDDLQSEKFTGTFYEPISDAEMLPLSFVLRRNRRVVLKRKAVHWWLTGFRLGMFSAPSELRMDAKIVFPNREMCSAFTNALRSLGYTQKEFSVRRTTVTIRYTTPHSEQPSTQEGIQKAAVQTVNQSNCRLYSLVTARYTNTLDKLEYLKAAMPNLYQFFLDSLYAKGFFSAFDWIRALLFGTSKPEPVSPAPPCPPEPSPCDPGPCDPGPCDPGPCDPGPCDPGPCDPGPCESCPSDPCLSKDDCPPPCFCQRWDHYCTPKTSCCRYINPHTAERRTNK